MPTAPRSISHRNRQRQPERRKNANARGYTYEWELASAAWLTEQFSMGNATCSWCGRLLSGARSDIVVDHIIDHKGNMELFWDQSNWQSLCRKPCHSQKTARENGFGRMGNDAHI